jgi:uncharacterized protein (TIGR02147 family)
VIARPVVFDYAAPHEFLADLLTHYKATSHFSVRQRAQLMQGCSPALISQVLAGRRRLTRDQLPTFAKIFKLNDFEVTTLDQSLTRHSVDSTDALPERRARETKNHILSDWIHVYVKDLVNLRGFSLDSKRLTRMLFGLTVEKRIQKSIEFLLREGFWRRTAENRVVPEDAALVSTNEIPNEKIRTFHKQALKIAVRGLDLFPSDRRKATTVLIAVDREKVADLKAMVDGFQTQLLKFIEEHPAGGDDLIQIAIHLTPVGASHD